MEDYQNSTWATSEHTISRPFPGKVRIDRAGGGAAVISDHDFKTLLDGVIASYQSGFLAGMDRAIEKFKETR